MAKMNWNGLELPPAYYQDDAVYIIHGDCREVLPLIPDKSIDLVLTDPPYKIGYAVWDNGEFGHFTDEWLKSCFLLLQDKGTMWSFMGYERVFEFVPLLQTYGSVHLENWVIWARQKGRGSSKHLKSQREDIFHTTKTVNFVWNNLKMLREVVTPYVKDGKPRGWFINEEGKRVRWTGLGNVWVYTAPQYNSLTDKQEHPAQKPSLLFERLILLSSNKSNLIIDPFLGSGTTAYCAKKLNRKCIGIEIEEKYCEIATKRCSQSVMRLEI